MTAEVGTDLYFDITGFRYDACLTSGGRTFFAAVTDVGTIRDTKLEIREEIPLAALVMMMLCGVSGDADTVLSVGIRGSTLGGMISASARANTVIADIVRGSVTVNDDLSVLNAEFTAAAEIGDIIDAMFG
ncbi:MAG: hypothetical protein LBH69_01420, partial [Methanomassiliicoccaceae archaeon]|nr:hypothetical protein [Methanomassiliicoccaceae archaeon]